MKQCKQKKVNPWTIEDLDIAIKDLDKGKARGALGYANEPFKDDVAGSNLKLALLKLMNHTRKEQNFVKLYKNVTKHHYTNKKGLEKILCNIKV